MTSNNPFSDCLTKEQFAASLPKPRTTRTIDRWISGVDGLPTIRIGNMVLIPADAAREWAMRRAAQRNPPRVPRGRTRSRMSVVERAGTGAAS
jgi:hypothetical protein